MLEEDKRPLTSHSRMTEVRGIQKGLQGIVLRLHAAGDLRKWDVLSFCELAGLTIQFKRAAKKWGWFINPEKVMLRAIELFELIWAVLSCFEPYWIFIGNQFNW